MQTLLGSSLIVASACVFNNYIDRNIDDKMVRTKSRALVKKVIPTSSALVYATILGLIGFFVLAQFTNTLTVLMGCLGLFFYVCVYSIWKRRSSYGTLVGSISGAIPPVAGYTAAVNKLDLGAALLFTILVFWQMPHFYAIAIRRRKEYVSAKVPVLPVKKGILRTKIEMLAYILAFYVAIVALAMYGYARYTYLIVMSVVSLIWVYIALLGFTTKDDTAWAKNMFLYSLIVTVAFAIMASVGRLLP